MKLNQISTQRSLADYATISFVEAAIAESIYPAYQITYTKGSTFSGTISDTESLDGTSLVIAEASGTPGIDAVIDFQNIDKTPTMIRMAGYYAGGASHSVAVQLWNYTGSVWETYHVLNTGPGIENHEFFIDDPDEHLDGAGNAKIRLYHVASGNTSHRFYLDYLTLVKAGIGSAGFSEAEHELVDHAKLPGINTTIKCWNASGGTFNVGDVVYLYGAEGGYPRVELLDPAYRDKCNPFGVVTETITTGNAGYVTLKGKVRGVNTSSFNAGDLLYPGVTPGTISNTAPDMQYYDSVLGSVTIDSTDGEIFFDPYRKQKLMQLYDLDEGAMIDQGAVIFDDATRTFKGKDLSYIPNVSVTVVPASTGVVGGSYTNPYIVGTNSERVIFVGAHSTPAFVYWTTDTPDGEYQIITIHDENEIYISWDDTFVVLFSGYNTLSNWNDRNGLCVGQNVGRAFYFRKFTNHLDIISAPLINSEVYTFEGGFDNPIGDNTWQTRYTLNSDQYGAAYYANAPSGSNPFATIDDLGADVDKEVIGITIDGGGSTFSTGSKGYREFNRACTINGWTMLADVSGSCVVDVKKCTYANFPTTSSIAGSEKPTLSSAQKNQDQSLTTWTTSVASGDILEFVVDSVTTVTKVWVFLEVTYT